MRTIVVTAAATTLVSACASESVRRAEAMPDVRCVVDDGRESPQDRQTVVVEADAAGEGRIGDLRFHAEWAGPGTDRHLHVTVTAASGATLQEVTYRIPGRGRLRNQFGERGDALTGEHRIVSPTSGEVMRWRCEV